MKKCCHGNTCCQMLPKNQSAPICVGYGKQRTHKNICMSKKKKKKVLPWQHLLPGVAEKLISCSLCRGMESKEPTKIFTSPRNKQKKCCHGNTCCQVCQKTNPLQSVQGYGKQRTYKIFISSRNRKKCCHGNTCCQLSLKN